MIFLKMNYIKYNDYELKLQVIPDIKYLRFSNKMMNENGE